MTILKLKNPTNIYRIDVKKTRRERRYLALEYLRIKSKFPRSNMPICEVGQSGERKNPRGRRKKRKKARGGRLGAGLKHHLGAIDVGAKLGAKIYDAKLGARIYCVELLAKSPPCVRWDQDLGASNDGAELRVHILKSYLQGHICEIFSKKGLKNKKSGDMLPTHLL